MTSRFMRLAGLRWYIIIRAISIILFGFRYAVYNIYIPPCIFFFFFVTRKTFVHNIFYVPRCLSVHSEFAAVKQHDINIDSSIVQYPAAAAPPTRVRYIMCLSNGKMDRVELSIRIITVVIHNNNV